MGYKGNVAQIVFGDGGLRTDDPQNKLGPTDLITANNVDFINGLAEKEPGSMRFNQTPLSAGVVSLSDFWTDDITQRLIALTRDGNVWKFGAGNGFIPATQITPTSGALASLIVNNQTVMVAGGYEVTGNPRKLFVFAQNGPQVIYGDGNTYNNLSAPALDWTNSNQPAAGIIHRSRLVAWGNRNFPHNIYLSAATNQEDFTSVNSQQIACFSGESERIIAGIVYKSRLFVMKYPFGVYELVDDDPSAANWYFTKIENDLGALSPHSISPIINDAIICNSNGMLSSITATLEFGNIRAGEILYILRNERFVRENMVLSGFLDRHSVYYSDKKKLMVTYRATSGTQTNRILYVDFMNAQRPKVSWSDKDQPNCLILRKDNYLVQRPIYGAEDGYIYLMDRKDRDVNSAGYNFEIQTPHLDFSHIDPRLGDINKIFEFLELDYEPTGDFNLTVEVYIDGVLAKTMTFNLGSLSNLDSFIADQSHLDPETIRSRRLPLQVSGRRISLRCYNSNSGENVRIARFNIYYKASAQQQKSDG